MALAPIGSVKFETVDDPAAGFGIFNFDIPNNKKWRLLSLTFTLATSATVANRLTRMLANTSVFASNSVVFQSKQITQTASNTNTYNFLNQYPFEDSAFDLTFIRSYIPDIWFPPGTSFVVQVNSIQAADQISNITFGFEEREA